MLCQHLRNEFGEYTQTWRIMFHSNDKAGKIELSRKASAFFDDKGNLTGGTGSKLIDPENGLYEYKEHNHGVVWHSHTYKLEPSRGSIMINTIKEMIDGKEKVVYGQFKHSHGDQIFHGTYFHDSGLEDRFGYNAQYHQQWNPRETYEVNYKDDIQTGKSESFFVLDDGSKVLYKTYENIDGIGHEMTYCLWPNWPEKRTPEILKEPTLRLFKKNNRAENSSSVLVVDQE